MTELCASQAGRALTTFNLFAHAALTSCGGIKLQSIVVPVDAEIVDTRHSRVWAAPVGVHRVLIVQSLTHVLLSLVHPVPIYIWLEAHLVCVMSSSAIV